MSANKDSKTPGTTVERRSEQFAARMATKIWREVPSEGNPYIASQSLCHGYDLTELLKKRSYCDVLLTLFRGDLPSAEESELFEKLMIAFINPGPRHPATRAAMNAGVGKTDPSHILPIGLNILSGEHLGSGEIEPAIRWMRKHLKEDPQQLARDLVADMPEAEGDLHIAPGFGSHYGGIDIMATKLAKELIALPGSGRTMKWAHLFAESLAASGMGWLSTGVVAAVLADLGFQPRVGPGIFQIISAPGLFAHGIEMASKPLTAMPFPDDKDYVIDFDGEA